MRGPVADTVAGVVDQDVEAAPALHGRGDHPDAVGFLHDIGLPGEGAAAVLSDHGGGLLSPLADAVDAQHLGALAGEQQRHGAAVADGLARRLARTHDDHALAVQSARHLQKPFRSGSSVRPWSSCTPKVFRNIETWVYWAAVNTTSMHC